VPETNTYEEEHKVMFYLYFVLNSANPIHSLADYAARLRAGCARLTKAGKTFALLGDLEWIQTVAPPCKLANKKASRQISLDALPKPRSLSNFTARIGGDCDNKLPLFHWRPMPWGRFRTLATIWHSKLGLLCDAARQHPDELSVLLDGGLMSSALPIAPPSAAEDALNRSLLEVNRTSTLHMEPSARVADAQAALLYRDSMALGWVDTDQRERERENGKLQVECYFEDCAGAISAKPGWHYYGKPACGMAPNDNARVAAGALALRGADCGAIEGAYMEALTEIASGACNCYDEEIVLSRMLDDARWEHLMKSHLGP
jgi:hypothetical protein